MLSTLNVHSLLNRSLQAHSSRQPLGKDPRRGVPRAGEAFEGVGVVTHGPLRSSVQVAETLAAFEILEPIT